MREDLIDAPELAVGVLVVHVLDAERHVLVFQMPLDAVQERDGVVCALGLRHPAALSADRDDVRHAVRRAHVNVGAERRLELVVNLLVDQAVREPDRAGAGHGRNQPVFLECRPVLLTDEIEPFESDLRRFAALIVERQLAVRAEHDTHQPLLQADLGSYSRRDDRRSRTRRKLHLAMSGQRDAGRSRHSDEELPAVYHVFSPSSVVSAFRRTSVCRVRLKPDTTNGSTA